jgi:chromosome partitioning protein
MAKSQRIAHVIAVAMQKGGVGKTTTTVNLSAELAKLGRRVLVIDADQQGHSTSGLGVELGDDDATFYEVLTPERADRVPLVEAIQSTEYGVDIVPGVLASRKLEIDMGPGGQMRLARQIDELTGYDLVLIDCPPALGAITEAALTAADDVMAILKPGRNEVEALIRLGDAVLDVQEGLNPAVDIRFVLVTDYDGGTRLAQDVRSGLIRDWGDWDGGGAYLGEIPHTVRVPEAAARCVPIAVHAPTSSAAFAYKDAAKRLDERVNA